MMEDKYWCYVLIGIGVILVLVYPTILFLLLALLLGVGVFTPGKPSTWGRRRWRR